MTQPRKAGRRLLAGGAALALALTGVIASGSAAMADPGPGQQGSPESGSLTITKYAGNPTDNANDGTEQDITGLEALGGVEFTVTQVGSLEGGVCTPIDLTTTEGWNLAQTAYATTPAAIAAPYCALTSQADTTATGTGVVAFENLDLTLYLVTETDLGDNDIIQPSSPFFVTVPLPYDNAGTPDWNYDVYAYPKNVVQEAPTKVLDGAPVGLVLGAVLPWMITSAVPVLNEGALFTSVVIADELDPRLSYLTAAPNAPVVTLTKPGVPDQVLTAGTHFTYSGSQTLTLTPLGLALLDATYFGGAITWKFSTEVTTLAPVGEGLLSNDATVSFNGQPPITTEEPTVQFGDLKALKYQAGSPTAGLAGAEFDLYDGACVTPIVGTPIDSTVSEADGTIYFAGLWVASYDDIAAVNPDAARDYCLVETKAPAGFVLPTGAAAQTTVAVKAGTTAAATWDTQIANSPTEGPDLPLTGSNGTIALTVGGVALLAVALGIVLIVRRRAAQR